MAAHTLEKSRLILDVLIPALNEEAAVGQVVTALKALGHPVRHVVVIDNGSIDGTASAAQKAGALVVKEQTRGYGAACLRGMAFLAKQEVKPDVVAFLDADGSDDAQDMSRMIDAIVSGADLVVGSRTLGISEPQALSTAQRVGNAVATTLIRAVYGQNYTDVGPFRLVRYPALLALGMTDEDHGFMIEMQVKAVRRGLRIVEVPVRYRPRIAGESKNVKGSLAAGRKMLFTILRHSTQR
ncbi:MAG: glycosyltransferase family 2 protein [Polyangia bacterium]